MSINERVRYLRKEVLGLSQAEFGAELHIRQTAVSMLETRTGVSDRNITDICARWNVSERWLRTGEGAIFKSPHIASRIDVASTRTLAIKVYESLDDAERVSFLSALEQAHA